MVATELAGNLDAEYIHEALESAPFRSEDTQRLADIIEKLKDRLPECHRLYIDKYFKRSKQILQKEELNPFVRAQVFIRKGPGEVRGVEEALAIIDKYSDFKENGGRVYCLHEGDTYDSKETLMILEGRIQDIVDLETMYLGVLTSETTIANGGSSPAMDEVEANMKAVVDLTEGRPVMYFGARHWRYDRDGEIARAAISGGATSTSTDIGSITLGQRGIGTIPHALENIMAAVYGKENAVLESTKAFDRVMDPEIPRIALVDYNNKEISDSLKTARALGSALHGVRVDTCGENIAEGAIPSAQIFKFIEPGGDIDEDIFCRLMQNVLRDHWHFDFDTLKGWKEIASKVQESGQKIDVKEQDYWFGTGVTISGVYMLRKALDEAGFQDTKIVLSSGFGNTDKVKAFVKAEEMLGVKLFDSLGVGGVYPARMATMDIIAVSDDINDLDEHPVSKVGRPARPNDRLSKAEWD